jgi:hypothetical protein
MGAYHQLWQIEKSFRMSKTDGVCPSLRIVAEWENDSREERPL